MRILSTESPRVPEQRSSTQGKSGPKPRRKAKAMDNRLKFLYRIKSIERRSDAGGHMIARLEERVQVRMLQQRKTPAAESRDMMGS